MLQSNQKKIAENKLKNKAGGLANESRFGGNEKELRKHKVLFVPSVNTATAVKFEQGWNHNAKKHDVVRVSIGDNYVIVTREELEQAIAYMAQGDELIKYSPPTVKGL